MKDLSINLFLAALVLLLYLIVPSNAVAQSDLDIPCCYHSLSSSDLLTNNVASKDSHLFPLLTRGIELGTSMEFEIDSQMPLIEIGTRNLLQIKDREIYGEEQIQSIFNKALP